jgi:TolB-like protein/Tfp pilus assembly protein PilF
LANIFISYAREDRERVARLAAALEGAGFTMWWDPLIEPGAEYVADTEKQLAVADAVIVVWSKHSIGSHWVRDEAGYAREKGNLVPILIDPVEPPLGFRQFQTADLSHWRGGDAPQLEAFLGNLHRRLGASGPHVAPAPDKRRKRVLLAAAAFAAAAAFGGALYLAQRRAPTAAERPAIDPASIAVLPFEDLSAGRDQQYFSDGVAEEILNVLAGYPGLKIAGRTSSFKFRNAPEDLREIALQLGVAHILEGSVRRQGDRVRVTAQIIKAEDGFHVWSETFDRDLTDIFAVQDEISRAVARALSLRIVSARQAESADLAAYDLYLKGREQLARRGVDSLSDAAALFKSASDLDPGFSSALSGRARALSLLWDYGFTQMSPETLAEAKGAAAAALKADPENAEAYSVLGYLNTIAEWNWAEAERNVRRAIALAPNDAEIANFSGDYFMYVGDIEESFANERRAAALDPLHAVNYQDLAWRYLAIGRCAEALAHSRKATEVDPAFGVDFLRGRAALCAKDYDEARAAADRLAAAGFRGPALDIEFALALARKRIAEARRVADMMERLALEGSNSPLFSAAHLAAVGEFERAAFLLEKAYEQKDPRMITDFARMLPEDWPENPAIRAALDKPELNALYDIRRRNLGDWRRRNGGN